MINKTLLLSGGNFFTDIKNEKLDNFSINKFLEKNNLNKKDLKVGFFAESIFFNIDSYEKYKEAFSLIGIEDIEFIDINDNNKNSSLVCEKIKEKNVIFFSGGGQDRNLFGVFYEGYENDEKNESLSLKTIRESIDSGRALFIGTSAGTMIAQGNNMITGGSSYESIVNGAYDSKKYISFNSKNLTIDYEGGLSFFNRGILDTHFSIRGRMGRLIAACAFSGTKLGFGIDLSTIAVYKQNSENLFEEIEVYGLSGGVHIIDLSKAQIIKSNDETLIQNVKYSRLSHGDSFNFLESKVKVSQSKKRIEEKDLRDRNFDLIGDVFSSRVLSRYGGGAINTNYLDDFIAKDFIFNKENSIILQSYEKPCVFLEIVKGQESSFFYEESNFNEIDLKLSTIENITLNISFSKNKK